MALRILFLLHRLKKARHFESVVALLAERGHTVILAAEQKARSKPIALPKSATRVNRRLAAANDAGRSGHIALVACPVQRSDEWSGYAPQLRRARDYARFLDPAYKQSPKLRLRAAAHAPPGWVRFLEDHSWIRNQPRAVRQTLAVLERAIPSEKTFEDFIRGHQPDLVLVTPLVNYGMYQTDYVKSAHRLGLPVGYLPFSWDNLTNRGLIRVPPDRMLVWNDIQKREAVELHGMPEERVIITGAPRFDDFFAMRPSTSREELCAHCRLNPDAPLLLYLCSSAFVAPREVEFVRRWIAAVRSAADPRLRDASVLVRPHPAHLSQWDSVDLCEFPNAARWSDPQTMNSDRGLFDSLFHSSAVIGLNTSAMIEAGILGKPVHTIITEEFAGGQEETIHFGYLRAANGGLSHEARGLDEHVTQLTAALRADASAGGQERRFIQRFVRPHGLDVPVTPIMVDEIERIAEIHKHPQHGTPLWHYPVRWAVRRVMAGRT